MNTIMKLGNITLTCPPTPDNYRVDHRIISGREATALSGAPLSLNVIRKKVWTLSFHPNDEYMDILALMDTETTFTDYDGVIYNVVVTGEPSINRYPITDQGQMTIILREI